MGDLLSLIVGVSFLYFNGICLNFNKYFHLNTTPMKKCIVLFLLILSNITYAQTKSKEEVLKSIVGQYELNDISASMGANTMVDYYKMKGLWKGTYSMLMGGRRESEGIKISPDVLKKLKTMKIKVNPDLSIVFSCNEIPIATIPFKADGMVYEMTGSYNVSSQGELSQLQPELTFQDGQLFLYAKDNLDETVLEPYDIADVLPNTILISYELKDKTFNVILCESEGMGYSTYTFKKSVVIKK